MRISGSPPAAVKDVLTIGGHHLKNGARAFGEWSAAMIKELGEAARPHLPGVYEQLRTQFASKEWHGEMTPREQIPAGEKPALPNAPKPPSGPAEPAAVRDPRITETFGDNWAPGFDEHGLPRGARTVPDGDPLLQPTVGKKSSESKKTAIIPEDHLLVQKRLLKAGEMPRKRKKDKG